MAKFTVVLLAELEIEDEGFLTDCVKEELVAGRVENLRPATLNELAHRPSLLAYLVPRLQAAQMTQISPDLVNHGAGHLALAVEVPGVPKPPRKRKSKT